MIALVFILRNVFFEKPLRVSVVTNDTLHGIISSLLWGEFNLLKNLLVVNSDCVGNAFCHLQIIQN